MNLGFKELLQLNTEAYLASKETPPALQQPKASTLVAKDPKPKRKHPPPPPDQIEELKEDSDQSTPLDSRDGSNSKSKSESDPKLDPVPTKRKALSTRSGRQPAASKVKISAPK